MSFLNEKAKSLKPSETLAVKARATELKAQGREIVDLSTGEPDIDTPEHIKLAAYEAMKKGKTKYTPVQGIPELREAIANKLKNENHINTAAKQIVVTNGGKQALFNLFDCTLSPGDEVVVIAPYWVSYPAMIEMAGGVSKIVMGDRNNGYRVSPEQLKSALTDRTKFVIINSPSNPTGLAYTAEELRELGKVVSTSKAMVVSDEVYEKVTYGGFKFSSFEPACPEMAGRVVTVNAFSKSYSMTGWRCGYASGPFEIIDAMIKHQSQSTSGINSITQYAALAALTGDHTFISKMNESFARRIALGIEELESANLKVWCRPQGAFYLFVDFSELVKVSSNPVVKDSAAFTAFLLDEAGVASVPGQAFGDNQCFRISVAASDSEVEKGVKAIRKAVSTLK